MTDLSEESAFGAGRNASAVWPRPVTVKRLSSFSPHSQAAVCRISSSPKETVSRALGLGNRKSCKNSTGEFARTRSGEKRRGLSAHSPSPRARHPNPRSRLHERPGKNGGFPFTILKPRAEGYETEIVTNLAF